MAVNLYRRHRQDCEGRHDLDSRSGEFEERKKSWRRCSCLIFASGTLSGRFKRKSTGEFEWEQARAIATVWDVAQSWEFQSRPISVAPQDEKRITILEACDAFLASCTNRGIAIPTLSKYKTFVKQLKAHCIEKGYVVLDQLSVADMDAFYATWKDAKRARAKKLERLKAFIKFCRKRKWLTEDIAEDLRAPEGSSIPANKTPFTDKELERIFAACDAIGGPKPPGPGCRPWGGEDVRDFVMLSIYTGLRISDVATFNISERLNGNDVFLRMHKTGKELYTWIPDWLVHRLTARAKKHGDLIFRAGEAANMKAMSERWRENLSKVFKLADPFDEPPTPHRFRHTFVRILLEKGVPTPDVAELIGDTEQVLRRHYSKWVKGRQARLTKILQEAFDDKPQFVCPR
jgi:integrase